MQGDVLKLRNKVAIVTGAGKGIGCGIALELANEGADLALVYNQSKDGAEKTAQMIKKIGREAVAIKADISQKVEVDRMVKGIIGKFRRIDILVNNAAITKFFNFLDITEMDWDEIIDTNLKGTFLCSQAAVKSMIKNNYGKIINIGSVHSKATIPEFTPYAASKGGIDSLTMQMALALAPYKINVNAISPGLIEVERFANNPSYNREERAKEVPLGRVGFPADVGKTVVFFASEDSDYITGQILYIDGGQLCRLALKRNLG
jgi:NAD(P)-dependent dehydrogenase (short-subunit alcohol dehydrogenase family)